MTQQDDQQRQWFKALGSVVTVAAIVGTVFGTVTYGAVRVTGLAPAEPSAAEHERSSRTRASAEGAAPRPEPASAREAADERSTAARPASEAGKGSRTGRGHERQGERRATHERRKHRAKHQARRREGDRLTLVTARHHVHRMGRIHLSGRYRGHAGTILVVQRLEHGRWQRFPVSAVVRGGRFRTWVASGRPGPNQFRVRDPRTHRRSAPVTVTVR